MTDELPALPPPEAHCWDCGEFDYGDFFTAEQMRAYAAAAVAAERERCAKLCEQQDDEGEGPDCWDWHAKDYAKAIRALGDK